MLTLNCLAQGSSGNCWLLESETECLILDAGVPIMTIKRGLNYNIEKVVGAIITHDHKDHSLSSGELSRMGISVYKPYEIGSKLIQFGEFIIQPFDLPHDGCECYGFFIKHKNHKMLYLTDFEYCSYNFSKIGINTILIEANYQDKYLETLENTHKILGHCEFEICKEFVKTNASDILSNVILTHMGIGTTNGKEMVEQIKKEVPTCNVDYAIPQKAYILSDDNCPF